MNIVRMRIKRFFFFIINLNRLSNKIIIIIAIISRHIYLIKFENKKYIKCLIT